MSEQARIAVILTCFNRVQKTLFCLSQVFDQARKHALDVTVFLVDDGSTDGTGAAVESDFPAVNVIYGDGSLFWNRGMHKAFGAALEDSREFEYYLWLNDDTFLYENCIAELLAAHTELSARGKEKSIIIPSTRDPKTDAFSYGGYRKNPSINKISMSLVGETAQLEPCDTFCGNCVLIPAQVAAMVGNINYAYQHRWGDTDYGLRALEQGIQTWIAPGYLADCESNPLADRWRDSSLGFSERIKEVNSLKGLGKNDWFQYTRRHAGWLWPLIWISPYLRIALSAVTGKPIHEK